MSAQKHHSALLVLGMHRSGTSALTGVLSLAGANPGPSLIPPAEGINPKGFWEHREIVAIHERLLAAMGTSWDDDRLLPESWWQFSDIARFRDQLLDVLRLDFSNCPFWILKDPRLCRLMPLWLEILSELKVRPHFIICLRHPLEVAKSLEHRDGIHSERACLLWLEHLIDSERWTRGHARTLVSYEQLLADWRLTVQRIVADISLPLQVDKAVEGQIDTFLEPALRHHHHADFNVPDSGSISKIAKEIYMVAKIGELDELTERLNRITEEIEQKARYVAPWSAEIRLLRNKNTELKLQVEQLITDSSTSKSELTRIKSTVSWRLTKPLRLLAFLWRKLFAIARK